MKLWVYSQIQVADPNGGDPRVFNNGMGIELPKAPSDWPDVDNIMNIVGNTIAEKMQIPLQAIMVNVLTWVKLEEPLILVRH